MGPQSGLTVEQGDLKWISWKTAFNLAITSAKRVGELHTLSVSESYMCWNADKSVVTLWPNPSRFFQKECLRCLRTRQLS